MTRYHMLLVPLLILANLLTHSYTLRTSPSSFASLHQVQSLYLSQRLHSTEAEREAEAELNDVKKKFWKQYGDITTSEVGMKERFNKLQEQEAKVVEETRATQRLRSSVDDLRKQMRSSPAAASETAEKKASSKEAKAAQKAAATAATKAAAAAEPKIPLPFMNVASLGLSGRWEERLGNFILLPEYMDIGTNSSDAFDPNRQQRPVAVIHFLGGAFVGAAPHLTYRFMLEELSKQGYIIVATPYPLELDYVKTCDQILSKFDAVAVELASVYGPLPVIGIGHSCGALLQTLITSLFPEAPRAVNVLISYNNKPINEAIPAFNELVAPISEQIMGESNAKFRDAATGLRNLFDDTVKTYADSRLTPAFVSKEILPLINQGLKIVDQLPPLLQEIADGAKEFIPSPKDTKEVVRRMYRARKSLLLKFENDDLDESLEIEKVLREANTIMRMKRPMIEMGVELKVIKGSHVTPLTPNIVATPPEALRDWIPFNPTRSQMSENFMQNVVEVTQSIIEFLDFAIKGVPPR